MTCCRISSIWRLCALTCCSSASMRWATPLRAGTLCAWDTALDKTMTEPVTQTHGVDGANVFMRLLPKRCNLVVPTVAVDADSEYGRAVPAGKGRNESERNFAHMASHVFCSTVTRLRQSSTRGCSGRDHLAPMPADFPDRTRLFAASATLRHARHSPTASQGCDTRPVENAGQRDLNGSIRPPTGSTVPYLGQRSVTFQVEPPERLYL